MAELVVDFRDEVRNTVSDVTGTVVAIYTLSSATGNITYVDVLCGDRVYWKSPVTNWEVVKRCDE
jgi:hypothetical protein